MNHPGVPGALVRAELGPTLEDDDRRIGVTLLSLSRDGEPKDSAAHHREIALAGEVGRAQEPT